MVHCPSPIKARAEKFRGLIVPRQNVREAAVVNNLEVYGMDTLNDVIQFFNGGQQFEPTCIDTRKEFYAQQGLLNTTLPTCVDRRV